MKYKHIITHILHLATCLLLLAAVAVNKNGKLAGYEFGAAAQPAAETVVAAVEATSSGDTTVVSSIGVADKVIGYAGTTPVEIRIVDDRIASVTPLPNDESPRFMQSVTESGILSRWNGLSLHEAVSADVDAVSGATYTSTAVIKTVRLTLSHYANSQPSPLAGVFSWKLLITLIAIACSVAMPFFFHSRAARYAQLVVNVAVIGFWSHSFISLSLMVNTLANGLDLATGIVPAALLLVGFVMPFFGKPGHYCNHVCPLGSLQELAGAARRHKWQPSPSLLKWLNGFRQALWIALLLVMAIGAGFDIMDYEAFSAFMLLQASPVVLVMALCFVLLSVFTPRPYCRFVCPTGSLLKFSQSAK